MTKTTNPHYGFYGTINGDKDAAWVAALAAVSKATGQPEGRVAVFLDSRLGRHFADQVNCEGLTATIQCWKAWRVSRTVRRQYRIAQGTDYLTAEITAAWHDREAA